MRELVTIFKNIALPNVLTEQFGAVTFPDFPEHRLAKNEYGEPAVLLRADARATTARPAPIMLQHIAVQYDVHCRIRRADAGGEEGRFTIIECRNADAAITRYFLHASQTIMATLGEHPTPDDVSNAVTYLVELFRALSAPPRKTIQGIWAELFLVTEAATPSTLVRAWHAAPEECYDFAHINERIEVKSSGTQIREHFFTAAQINPPRATRAMITSLFVERSGGGTSLGRLLEEARQAVGDPHLVARIDQIVTTTLGSEWRQALTAAFDAERARESLRFYDVVTIPGLRPPFPANVSDVRFKSDLTGVEPLTELAGALFVAARPRSWITT